MPPSNQNNFPLIELPEEQVYVVRKTNCSSPQEVWIRLFDVHDMAVPMYLGERDFRNYGG